MSRGSFYLTLAIRWESDEYALCRKSDKHLDVLLLGTGTSYEQMTSGTILKRCDVYRKLIKSAFS